MDALTDPKPPRKAPSRRPKTKLRRAWLRARRDKLRACLLARAEEPPDPASAKEEYKPRLLRRLAPIAPEAAAEPAPPAMNELAAEDEAVGADNFVAEPAEWVAEETPDPLVEDEFVEHVPQEAAEEPLLLAEDDAPFDPPDASDEVFGRPFERPEIIADAEEAELEANNGAARRRADASRPAPEVADQPVPTIDIHACWDRPETAEAFAALAADKRMARASFTLERGGLDSAACRFEDGAGPDLLIIETTLSTGEILASFDRLALYLARGGKIIVLGAVNDVTLLRELAARGVSEYIVAPAPLDDLAGAICRLFANVDKSRVIAIVGARGGIGASTLAYSIAWSIAERQQNSVTLVDLDLPFGAAAFNQQQEGTRSIGEALFAADRLNDALFDDLGVRPTPRLHVLTAPAALGSNFEPVPEVMEIVINRVRRTSAFVVLDVPHQWNAWVKQTLVNADEVLVVAAPDLASLRNTEHLLSVLKSERKQGSVPIVALSMVGIAKRPEIALKDFAEATRSEPVASFPFDPALFGAATLKCEALGESAPGSKVANAIDMLACDLTGRPMVDPKKARKDQRLPVTPPAPAPVLELSTPLPPEPAPPAPEPVVEQPPVIAVDETVDRAEFADDIEEESLALVEFPVRRQVEEAESAPDAQPLALAGVRKPRIYLKRYAAA